MRGEISKKRQLTRARRVAYDEQDGDFVFTRATKRAKTAQPEPIAEEEDDELAPAPAPASNPTSKRGRPAKQKEDREEVPKAKPAPPKAAPKRTSKRRPSQSLQTPVPSDDALPAPPQPSQPQPRTTRNRTSQPLVRSDDPVPPPPPPSRTTRNRISQTPVLSDEVQPPQRTTRQKRRSSVDQADPIPTKATTKAKIKTTKGGSKSRRLEEEREVAAQSTPMDIDRVQRTEGVAESQQIALPFSDTPIINRNKEMRKKTGNRRSSLGMRGRRASSLINSGHSAIPHREVDAAEFYKHIEADGLTEPRRMKQLLTWCGERSLAEKPPLGSSNSNAVLGGTDKPTLHADN